MDSPKSYHCPSAQPDMVDVTVIGVVQKISEMPEIAYLDEPLRPSTELLELTRGVELTRIFRFAAKCEEHHCQHFSGQHCCLVERIVSILPPVVEQLPECSIRSDCRWFAEHGSAACQRCPQIVTLNDSNDPAFIEVTVTKQLKS